MRSAKSWIHNPCISSRLPTVDVGQLQAFSTPIRGLERIMELTYHVAEVANRPKQTAGTPLFSSRVDKVLSFVLRIDLERLRRIV